MYAQNIWTILVTHATVQGLLLFVLLFCRKRGNPLARRAIGLLCLLFSLLSLSFLFEYFAWYEAWPHGIWLTAPLWYLPGALIWLFTEASTRSQFRWRTTHFLHVLPVLFAFYYVSSFYMLTGLEKLEFYRSFYQRENYEHDWFTYGHLLLFAGYLTFAYFRFRDYHRQVGLQHSNEAAFAFRWVNLVLASLTLFVIISLFYNFILALDFQQFIGVDFLTFLFLSLSVQVIGIAALLYPERFFVTPLEESEKNIAAQDFAQDHLILIAAQLSEFMKKERPYLDPSLRLSGLAVQMGVPAHHISLALNRVMDKNFYEFINAYRVDEVKRCLIDPNLSQFTLVAIGERCGFNSSASFYRIFKQHTGMTPSKFKQLG